MSRHDNLDRELAEWMRSDAAAPAPAGTFEQVVTETSQHRPRPAWFAGVGSEWVGDAAVTDLGHRVRSRPAAVLLFALLVIALVAAALGVGARLLQDTPVVYREWPAGRLAYATQDGDVFMADADGTDPVRIADAPFQSGWLPQWSPDGRHLLYSTDATYVVDSTGGMVLSTEGCCAAWSPDGTMIATVTGPEDFSSMIIVVTGIDGSARARLELPGPINYLGSGTRIYWTPDGRGITLTGAEWPAGGCCEGLGAVIPIDGSAHYQLPVLPSPEASTVFSRTGDLLVGHGTRQVQVRTTYQLGPLDTTGPDSLQFLVAAYVGGTTRALVPEGRVTEGPWYPHVWSPDDRRLVASHYGGDGNFEQLYVIDVATGQLTLLAATPITQSESIPLRARDWDAASDRIIFERGEDLWVIRGNGTDARPFIQGAHGGSWQPSPG